MIGMPSGHDNLFRKPQIYAGEVGGGVGVFWVGLGSGPGSLAGGLGLSV